uniref:hypothetical protein n=1 Tax=Sedimenticola hydrogenitrophicus TaxID=2967975 RepID=UPI0023B0E92B
MANVEFRAFKQSDAELIWAFSKVAEEMNEAQANLIVYLAHQHNRTIQTALGNAAEDPAIK